MINMSEGIEQFFVRVQWQVLLLSSLLGGAALIWQRVEVTQSVLAGSLAGLINFRLLMAQILRIQHGPVSRARSQQWLWTGLRFVLMTLLLSGVFLHPAWNFPAFVAGMLLVQLVLIAQGIASPARHS